MSRNVDDYSSASSHKEVGYILAIRKHVCLKISETAESDQHQAAFLNQWVAADIVRREDSCFDCCHDKINNECHAVVTCEPVDPPRAVPFPADVAPCVRFKIHTDLFNGHMSGIYCDTNGKKMNTLNFSDTAAETSHLMKKSPFIHTLFANACDEDSTSSNPDSNVLLVDGKESFEDDAKDCDSSKSSSSRELESMKRSDISLILGAALQSQQLGHIQIETAQLLLHQDDETDEINQAPSSRFQVMNATLLLTISIPNLENGGPFLKQSRNINKYVLDGVPSITQLFFTLIDTNWDLLEEQLPLLQLHSPLLSLTRERGDLLQKPSRSTIFPPSISLENLYRRIQDIAADDGPSSLISSASIPTTNEKINVCQGATTCLLQCLPREILEEKIAPYLHAKSFYAWRCSSKHFFYVLDAYVPGMKLQLYRHQRNSLNWMQTRESQFLKLSGNNEGSDYRCVTASVHLVLATRQKQPRRYYHFNTTTGAVILRQGQQQQHSPLSCEETEQFLNTAHNTTRGGLLCDDAGLGKTITVLSLVLRTMGQSTHQLNPAASTMSTDDEIFYLYWKNLDKEIRKRKLLEMHNLMRKQARSRYFDHPVDLSHPSMDGYTEHVSSPICMAEIRMKITHGYDAKGGEDFTIFCRDFNLMYRNVTAFHPPDSPEFTEGVRLGHFFEHMVREYKNHCILTASNKRNMNEEFNRLVKKKKVEALAPAFGTLLVVPKPLLSHWQDQMMMYIDFSYFGRKIPLIFHHRSSKRDSDHEECMDSKFCYHTSSISDAIQRCEYDETHFAAVFIDHEPSLKLPHDFIAQFYIVLTTVQRLSNSWRNGSSEDEKTLYRSARTSDSCISPLLKVNWLRLIVDEGHTMGKGSHGNAVQCASWICAQRRWAMTGTPTPQTNRQSDVRNILGLLQFLQHDFLSSEKIWKNAISKSWNEQSFEGYFRLCHLLSLLMRRHTKDSIRGLPPPRFSVTYTELSPGETLAYNTLTETIRSNIVITSLEAKTSGWEDSLLNPKHSSHADKALQNVRLSCCGGRDLIPSLTQKSYRETLEILEKNHHASDMKLQIVKKFLDCARNGGKSSCSFCGIQLQVLLLLPCTHLICSECIDTVDTMCPVCKKKFDPDEFQLLQPGFDVIWEWNLSNDSNTSRSHARQSVAPNPNESPVNYAVSQHGTNYHQRDESDPSQQQDVIGLEPLVASLNRRLKKGEPHSCRFPNAFTNGKCYLCYEEHNFCDLVNEKKECCTCHRKAEECPEEDTKASYIIRQLLQLIDHRKNRSSYPSRSSAPVLGESITAHEKRDLKVIIFSQFRKILDVVGDRLIRRLGNGVVAEHWGSCRDKELKKFKSSPSCICMLLSKDGSHGLDLSYVTNIIFLDEIYDKSLKHQVVSRAWRMGAEHSVQVEQLVAKNSIEEVMLQMNQTDEETRPVRSIGTRSNNRTNGSTHSKLHFLLTNLKLIRPMDVKRPISEVKFESEIPRKKKEARVRFDI